MAARSPAPETVSLVVRRRIRAAPERLFAAWTSAAELVRWWGPPPVVCREAEIDLRVGGRYRIANQFPDGSVLWITGAFERVAPPRLLIYTWRIEPAGTAHSAAAGPAERVTVRFEPRDGGTEVVILHERIADLAARERHAQGWNGCLDRLAAMCG